MTTNSSDFDLSEYKCPKCGGQLHIDSKNKYVQIITCVNKHFLGVIDNRALSILSEKIPSSDKALSDIKTQNANLANFIKRNKELIDYGNPQSM